MSSATSIDNVLPPEGGSHRESSHVLAEGHKQSSNHEPRASNHEPRGFRLQAEGKDAAFGVWHFFVLLSLIAATVAVLLTRQNTPENLILISLTIAAAGAAAAGLYRTLAPLATPEKQLAREAVSDRLRADLEREKMLALRSIKELEFDRAMGKVSAQDFEEMATRLRSRALGLMKRLDEGDASYRAVIERELQGRLQHRRDDKPVLDRRATHVCACGTTNDTDAKFCKSCGTRLEVA